MNTVKERIETADFETLKELATHNIANYKTVKQMAEDYGVNSITVTRAKAKGELIVARIGDNEFVFDPGDVIFKSVGRPKKID